MEAEKIYICVSCGNRKKDGKPYSIIQAVKSNSKGSWLDSNDKVVLDVIKPVGSKLRCKMNIE